MTPHIHPCSHFSVLFSSVQNEDRMSKRQAEQNTESATAKQRPVRNLSANVKVNRTTNQTCVVRLDQPSQTIKAGGDSMRQHSKPASSAASMEKQNLVKTEGSDPARKRSTPNVQLSKDEFRTSDPTLLHQFTNDAEDARTSRPLPRSPRSSSCPRGLPCTFQARTSRRRGC